MRDNEIRILCYGDSNTWGYIPGTEYVRYLKNERWTGILQTLLGKEYEVIEEGLNSRTLLSNDKRSGKEGRNGFEYLIPCLDTHDPVDLVVLMLGSNELKESYNKSAKQIGKMIERFVKVILNRKSQYLDSYPQIILVCPPPINEETEFCQKRYVGATKKSEDCVAVYQDIAQRYDLVFVDTHSLSVGKDGAHLTKESHKELAEILYQKIKKQVK